MFIQKKKGKKIKRRGAHLLFSIISEQYSPGGCSNRTWVRSQLLGAHAQRMLGAHGQGRGNTHGWRLSNAPQNGVLPFSSLWAARDQSRSVPRGGKGRGQLSLNAEARKGSSYRNSTFMVCTWIKERNKKQPPARAMLWYFTESLMLDKTIKITLVNPSPPCPHRTTE